MKSLFAAYLSLATICCAQPGGFTISGVVVAHNSGQPLKNAAVTIASNAQRDQRTSCITADDGRFVFSGLPPGKYNLSAARRGFVADSFQGDGNYSTGIAVGPGLDSEHIIFPLTATGSISGTVVDEEGDPVAHAQIWAFHKAVISGRSRMVMQGSHTTDSTGQFTISRLAPGPYFVGVQGRPWYANNQPMPPTLERPDQSFSELDVVFPITYYGDVTDPAAASLITVSEGSTANIRIALRAVPAVHVQLSGRDLKQPGGMQAFTIQEGPGGFPIRSAGGGIAFVNNRPEIIGLPPGRYDLTLQRFQEGRQELLGAKAGDFSHDAALDLSEIAKPLMLGQITFEAPGPPGDPAVLLSRSDQTLFAPIDSDGKFAFGVNNPLRAGRYHLSLRNAPDYYLKSISAKGAKFSRGELEIADGASVQLSLVAARGVTQINGTALKEDQLFAGAMILLLPQDPVRTDLIRRDQSDSDGTFSLPNVAPGRYTLVAIDDGHGLEYEEPAVIKPYLSQGQPIQVPVPQGAKVEARVMARQ